jgi:hypothetical protein
MSNMWDELEKKAASMGGGGLFISLKNDGDSAVVAFVGEPEASEVAYESGKVVAYDPSRHERPSTRVKIRCWDPESGRVKIWECSLTAFKGVLQVRKKYGQTKWLFEIKRHGAAGSTDTRYTVLPERELTVDEVSQIKSAHLPSLSAGGDGGGSGERPASPEEIAQLRADLGKLPNTEARALLSECFITKLSDATAAQVSRLRPLVDSALGLGTDSDLPF